MWGTGRYSFLPRGAVGRSCVGLGGMSNHDTEKDRFAELLTEHQDRIFRFVYASVRNLADAEGLFPHVALVLWQRFEEFVPGTNFEDWATALAELTIEEMPAAQRQTGETTVTISQ